MLRQPNWSATTVVDDGMDIRTITIACACALPHTTTIGLPQAQVVNYRALTLFTICLRCAEAYNIELTEDQINVIPMSFPPLGNSRRR